MENIYIFIDKLMIAAANISIFRKATTFDTTIAPKEFKENQSIDQHRQLFTFYIKKPFLWIICSTMLRC